MDSGRLEPRINGRLNAHELAMPIQILNAFPQASITHARPPREIDPGGGRAAYTPLTTSRRPNS